MTNLGRLDLPSDGPVPVQACYGMANVLEGERTVAVCTVAGRLHLALTTFRHEHDEGWPARNRADCHRPLALEHVRHAVAGLDGNGTVAGQVESPEVGHRQLVADRPRDGRACRVDLGGGQVRPELLGAVPDALPPVSYTHLRAHETRHDL